jgi:hypothetical protein
MNLRHYYLISITAEKLWIEGTIIVLHSVRKRKLQLEEEFRNEPLIDFDVHPGIEMEFTVPTRGQSKSIADTTTESSNSWNHSPTFQTI